MTGAKPFIIPALLFLSGCTTNESRPVNVSSTATLIRATKGAGVWQECHIESGAALCKITNRGDIVIYSEPFVVYEGSKPERESDLSISEDGGEQWVRLRNGTILIPSSAEMEIDRKSTRLNS